MSRPAGLDPGPVRPFMRDAGLPAPSIPVSVPAPRSIRAPRRPTVTDWAVFGRGSVAPTGPISLPPIRPRSEW